MIRLLSLLVQQLWSSSDFDSAQLLPATICLPLRAATHLMSEPRQPFSISKKKKRSPAVREERSTCFWMHRFEITIPSEIPPPAVKSKVPSPLRLWIYLRHIFMWIMVRSFYVNIKMKQPFHASFSLRHGWKKHPSSTRRSEFKNISAFQNGHTRNFAVIVIFFQLFSSLQFTIW